MQEEEMNPVVFSTTDAKNSCLKINVILYTATKS
jgi:hypothetical protein